MNTRSRASRVAGACMSSASGAKKKTARVSDVRGGRDVCEGD